MIPVLTVALAVFGQAMARADFVAYTPSESSITKDEKLFIDNDKGTLSLTGHVGSQSGPPVIDITANDEVSVAGSGWSTIAANKGNLTSVTFTPEDKNKFVDFTLRGQFSNKDLPAVVTITVFDGSQSFHFTETTAGDWSRIGVIAVLGSGEFIDHVVVSTDSSSPFKELKQIAFSTLADHTTPEPSSMAIAGLGALGFVGFGLRRRLKK